MALPADDVPGIRDELAKGVVPSNDLLDKYLDQYQAAVSRRLHPPSVAAIPVAKQSSKMQFWRKS